MNFDSQLLVSATLFAFRLHENQTRKVSGVPYISHLMHVAATVLEHGGTTEEAIAGMLHDSIEDAGALSNELTMLFGERAAMIVVACTEDKTETDYRKRKSDHLDRLERHSTLDRGVRLVVLADKLDNVRGLASAVRERGPAVFERFNGKREGSLWYYGEIAKRIARRAAADGDPLAIEYLRALADLEALCAACSTVAASSTRGRACGRCDGASGNRSHRTRSRRR